MAQKWLEDELNLPASSHALRLARAKMVPDYVDGQTDHESSMQREMNFVCGLAATPQRDVKAEATVISLQLSP